MKRRMLASLIVATVLLAPTRAALAAPANAPSGQTFPITCGGTTTYVVVTNSGQSGSHGRGNPSAFSPAFIVEGGSGLLIPTSFTFTFTITDTSTNPPTVQTFTSTSTKGNAQAGGLGGTTTCTFGSSQTVGTVTFTFSGTVTVVINTHAHT